MLMGINKSLKLIFVEYGEYMVEFIDKLNH